MGNVAGTSSAGSVTEEAVTPVGEETTLALAEARAVSFSISYAPADVVIALAARGLDLKGAAISEKRAVEQIDHAVSQGGFLDARVQLPKIGVTTASLEAAGGGKLQTLVHLKEKGANLLTTAVTEGWNALTAAADNLQVGSILLLTHWGLDPDLQTSGGWSPRTLVDGAKFLATRTLRENSNDVAAAKRLRSCRQIEAIFDADPKGLKTSAERLLVKVNGSKI